MGDAREAQVEHRVPPIPVEPCPFCEHSGCNTDGHEVGCAAIGDIKEGDESNADCLAICCGCCNLTGPSAQTDIQAIEVWNVMAAAVRIHFKAIEVEERTHRARHTAGLHQRQPMDSDAARLKAVAADGPYLIHDGKFIIGHDTKMDRVALTMSETLGAVAIDPMVAVTLALGLVEVAAIINPATTDHYASLTKNNPYQQAEDGDG